MLQLFELLCLVLPLQQMLSDHQGKSSQLVEVIGAKRVNRYRVDEVNPKALCAVNCIFYAISTRSSTRDTGHGQKHRHGGFL